MMSSIAPPRRWPSVAYRTARTSIRRDHDADPDNRASVLHDVEPHLGERTQNLADGPLVGPDVDERRVEVAEHPIERGVGDVQAAVSMRHLPSGVAARPADGCGEQFHLVRAEPVEVRAGEEPGERGVRGDPLVELVDGAPDPRVCTQRLVGTPDRIRHPFTIEPRRSRGVQGSARWVEHRPAHGTVAAFTGAVAARGLIRYGPNSRSSTNRPILRYSAAMAEISSAIPIGPPAPAARYPAVVAAERMLPPDIVNARAQKSRSRSSATGTGGRRQRCQMDSRDRSSGAGKSMIMSSRRVNASSMLDRRLVARMASPSKVSIRCSR